MTLGPWGDAALGAREVLRKATRRSAAETREALAAGITDPATPFRLGDLSRAQWFLWTGANLAATERTGRGLVAAASQHSTVTLSRATPAADSTPEISPSAASRSAWLIDPEVSTTMATATAGARMAGRMMPGSGRRVGRE